MPATACPQPAPRCQDRREAACRRSRRNGAWRSPCRRSLPRTRLRHREPTACRGALRSRATAGSASTCGQSPTQRGVMHASSALPRSE
ncbi:MAG: hypothetical protein MZU79_00830 [Anaerotruncus sp.]|nr:hypothetical protein [Anaerotruncus sp.]